MATSNSFFDHPSFHVVEDSAASSGGNERYQGTILELEKHLREDKEAASNCGIDLVQFVFFDFDDTLHHTITATKQHYFFPYSKSDLEKIRVELEKENLYFNEKDPPVHPRMTEFLQFIRKEYKNVLLLSAGSAAQSSEFGGEIGKMIEFTLFSNYARLWQNCFNTNIFEILGTDPSLFSSSSSSSSSPSPSSSSVNQYLSPSSLSLKGQLFPPEKTQDSIAKFFAKLDEYKNQVQSDVTQLSSDSFICTERKEKEIVSSLFSLTNQIRYFYYHGVIPVYGTKRDALLRFMFHVHSNHSTFSKEKKVVVYFVDDQQRYLRDVGDFVSSLFLTSIQREDSDFVDFIKSDRFIIKTFLMPLFLPNLSSSLS